MPVRRWISRRERPSTCFIRLISAHCSTPSNAFLRSRSTDRARSRARPDGASGRCAGDPLLDRRRRTSIQAAPTAGGFAGPVHPDGPIGIYSGHIRRRHQGAASFATSSFAGDTDRQRKGSFGDIERAEIVTHKDHTERSRGVRVASGGREPANQAKTKVGGRRERVSHATPYEADG